MQPAKAVAAEASTAAAELNGAAVAGMARPDAMGRFGKFGGKYVPETLMHALTELESAFHALATDEEFQVTPPAAAPNSSAPAELRIRGDSVAVAARRSIFHSWGGFERSGHRRSMGVV
jgi:hypothetical protein